jgi:Flp pilus assembly protein CpaB
VKIKWSIVMLACLGVCAALCAAVLTATLRATPIKAVAAAPPPVIDVLVAARPISGMTVVTTADIEKKSIVRTKAPKGHLSDPLQVVGKVVSLPVLEGQALTHNMLPPDGSGAQLAGMLPPGKRALSISLSEYSGLEGLIYPGCVVDVLAAFDVTSNRNLGKAVSTTLLENIQVLAVENLTVGSSEDKTSAPGAQGKTTRRGLLVTVMVDSSQAEALQLAIEHGDISLAMRNPNDALLTDRDATLLSDGRLAQVAKALGPDVLSEEAKKAHRPLTVPKIAGVSDDAPMPGAVKPKPKVIPQYKIDVYRGTDTEVRSFPQPRRK